MICQDRRERDHLGDALIRDVPRPVPSACLALRPTHLATPSVGLANSLCAMTTQAPRLLRCFFSGGHRYEQASRSLRRSCLERNCRLLHIGFLLASSFASAPSDRCARIL